MAANLTGGTVTVPSGSYAPFVILQSNLTVACADGATCTVDASGFPGGITIGDPLTHSVEVSNVTLSGFTILGDASTTSGVLVAPRTNNITVDGNTISGMALANPGNASPLAYGVLTYGGTVHVPSDITISNNTISGVHGAGISLGANTSNVSVTGNAISGIVSVDLAGNPFSVGVQGQAAANVTVDSDGMFPSRTLGQDRADAQALSLIHI